MTHIADMLRLYRASRGWTVRELAPKIGISIATLSRVERGHAMDAATLVRLINWLIVERS